MRMTNEEIMDALRSDMPLNRARAVFSSEAARMEQANLQQDRLGPIEARGMEFEAVRKIAKALGVDLP